MTTSNVSMGNEAIFYLENIAQHTVERSTIKERSLSKEVAPGDVQPASTHRLTGQDCQNDVARDVASVMEESV